MSHKLFSEFPPITAQQWEEQIAADLKGKTIEDLQTKLSEDITIKPFYSEGPSTIAKSNSGWIICQQIDATDGQLGNQASLKAIEQGATGLRLIVNRQTNIHALLEDLPLDKIQVDFLQDRECWNVLDDIRMIPYAYGITGAIDYDLVAVDRESDIPQLFDEYAALLPNYRLITLHENEELEPAEAIADLLRRANHYVKELLRYDYSIETIAAKMQFATFVDTDYFVSIAKLRALRNLWQIMLQEYDPKVHPVYIHADNLTAEPTEEKDAYYNMIRHTTQAMSAIIGGADSIAITPEDDTDKGAFLQRIALNAQLVLQHEAKLDKVADPASGAYFIENLTEQLAESAWALFLKE